MCSIRYKWNSLIYPKRKSNFCFLKPSCSSTSSCAPSTSWRSWASSYRSCWGKKSLELFSILITSNYIEVLIIITFKEGWREIHQDTGRRWFVDTRYPSLWRWSRLLLRSVLHDVPLSGQDSEKWNASLQVILSKLTHLNEKDHSDLCFRNHIQGNLVLPADLVDALDQLDHVHKISEIFDEVQKWRQETSYPGS